MRQLSPLVLVVCLATMLVFSSCTKSSDDTKLASPYEDTVPSNGKVLFNFGWIDLDGTPKRAWKCYRPIQAGVSLF